MSDYHNSSLWPPQRCQCSGPPLRQLSSDKMGAIYQVPIIICTFLEGHLPGAHQYFHCSRRPPPRCPSLFSLFEKATSQVPLILEKYTSQMPLTLSFSYFAFGHLLGADNSATFSNILHILIWPPPRCNVS